MALYDYNYSKTIVKIGDNSGSAPKPLGSGVVINWKNNSYVITTRHVIEQAKKPAIFVNHKIQSPLIVFGEVISDTWINHTNDFVDLTGTRFEFDKSLDVCAIEKKFQKFNDIRIGEDVFYLGYPFNLTPQERLIPLYRKGCISQKFPTKIEISIGSRKLNLYDKMMIIDAHVSKGNSGCPVFTYPRYKRKGGQTSLGPYLCGIVQGHILSVIKNFSDRPIGQEHSGLGLIYSIDTVIELLNEMSNN